MQLRSAEDLACEESLIRCEETLIQRRLIRANLRGLEGSMATIVVVEDDIATNNEYREVLETIPNTLVLQAHTYEEAKRIIGQGGLDLLLIDIDLGGPVKGQLRGFDLLQEFGHETAAIIVTGMPEETLHATALKLKAYDFIRKPIQDPDLLNKVTHALGFTAAMAAKSADSWPPNLDPDVDRPPNLLWKKKAVNLTLTELTIVHCLARRAGETIPHDKLAAAMKTGDSSRALAQHMAGVRKKFLDADPAFDQIETDPGTGYRWRVGEP